MIPSSPLDVNQAAAVLHDGGLVAFPTETYYGLAVDPFNEQALETLFRVKRRPRLKPILLLVAHLAQLDMLVRSVPPAYSLLMEKFWPGPLTLVFPARSTLSSQLTGGTGTVGVRLSPNPVANELIRAFGGPITATSANRSGEKPAECAEEIQTAFDSDVALLQGDDGAPGGVGSTLVGMQEGKLCCLRQGCIVFDEILAVVGSNYSG